MTNVQRLNDQAAAARDRLRDIDSHFRPLVRGRQELQAEWDAQRAPHLAAIAARDAYLEANPQPQVDQGQPGWPPKRPPAGA